MENISALASADAAAPIKRGPGRPRKVAAEKPAKALVDQQQLKAFLNIASDNHVDNMVRAGVIPRPYRIGALKRWDLDEVARHLREQRDGPAPKPAAGA